MSITPEIEPVALRELENLFGDRLDTSPHQRYSSDMVSDRDLHRAPAALVRPHSTAEVAELMRIASRFALPVTARGGGSGLAGGAIAARGGILCLLDGMDAIREIDATSLMAVVEAGVITADLDAALREHDLFFAGYPMSEEICTIGGNIATNAGGGRAVRYGVTGSHVFGLEVVTASGEVLSLGGKRIKDVTGLNLMPLFVGSEGILGIITAATIRLTPRPRARRALLALFPGVTNAVDAVGDLRRQPHGTPSALEFVDGPTARATDAERRATDRLPVTLDGAEALLIIEIEGRDESSLNDALAASAAVVARHGGTVALGGVGSPDADALIWSFRKAVPWWVKRTAGRWHSVEDLVVPIGAIPELIAGARRIAAASPLDVAIFGHAGDGNFHINPMKPEAMQVELWPEALHHLLAELYALARSLGGTISGEHGIGRKRVSWLPAALSQAEIEAMRAVKAALDPLGILNPGVLLP